MSASRISPFVHLAQKFILNFVQNNYLTNSQKCAIIIIVKGTMVKRGYQRERVSKSLTDELKIF